MELREFTPKVGKSIVLPSTKEVVLVPLGDIQLGAPGCKLDRLKKHIKWAEGLRAAGAEVLYVGMGDYIDVVSPSNRKILKKAFVDLYDSAKLMFDDAADRLLKDLQKVLAPTKGHWIGLLSGHHLYEFEDGTNSDTRLAQFLETTYLGDSAMLHLRFGKSSSAGAATCKIWLHHGQGGGQGVAAALNKIMQRAVPYWMANLYMIGHYHTKQAIPIPWIDSYVDKQGEVRLTGTTRYLVCTGGWLAGYEEGTTDGAKVAKGNYIEKAMLSPHTLGAPVIYIRPVRERKDGASTTRIDINVSV